LDVTEIGKGGDDYEGRSIRNKTRYDTTSPPHLYFSHTLTLLGLFITILSVSSSSSATPTTFFLFLFVLLGDGVEISGVSAGVRGRLWRDVGEVESVFSQLPVA
jgi:hypothetical protein